MRSAGVRVVVHFSLPKTLEGFYQESGRAGRDGQPAKSVLFYDIEDRQRMDYILSMYSSNAPHGLYILLRLLHLHAAFRQRLGDLYV